MGSEESQGPVATSNISRTAFTATLWLFFVISTILIICRLTIRLWLHRKIFWDDIFSIFAYFLLLSQMVIVAIATPNIYLLAGVYDGSIVPGEDFFTSATSLIEYMFAHSILFTTCIYAVKGSFLALFWRLIHSLPVYRKFWWAVVIFCASSYLVTVILFPITCSNLVHDGCTDDRSIFLNLVSLRFGTAVDISSDVFVMILPIAFVMKSYLPLPQKIGLISLFGLGFCIIAMSVLRIISTNTESQHPPVSWLVFWGVMESAVAVMTSCFAAFKSLFAMRKRPSDYRHSNSAYQLSKYGRSQGDMDVRLTQRMGLGEGDSRSTSKHDATCVITSEPDGGNKWADDDSREEILQRTEFEVRVEAVGPNRSAKRQDIPAPR